LFNFSDPRHVADSVIGGIMDFIERLFGIAPDGGSGLLEAVYFVVATGLVTSFARWRRGRAFGSKR